MQIRYCIECEKYVNVEDGVEGPVHMIYIPPTAFEPADVNWCEGPFTQDAPPELNDEMIDAMLQNAPSADELAQMDQEASNFLGDVQ